MDELNWAYVSEEFQSSHPSGGAWSEIVGALRTHPPRDILERLPVEAGSQEKADAREFLLLAIRHAVADHALSDDEVLDLRHVARVLRIEEGDLLTHHRNEIRELLCSELQRLLEDRAIDSSEAIHKVRLQEVLGLGYDQFVSLTSPVIEGIIAELVRQIAPDSSAGPTPEDVRWFREQLSALDTVYNVHPRTIITGGRGGYLYLLANPSMPGLLKIGRTSRVPDDRMMELAAATGVPTPFLLIYDVFVVDAEAAEGYVHQKLEERGYRVADNREFFKAPPSLAVDLMLEARNAVSAA